MKDSNSKQTARNESRTTTSSAKSSHVNNPEGINQYSDKKGSGSHNTSVSGSSTSKTHNSASKSSGTSTTGSRTSHVNNPEGINQYSDKKNSGKTSR